LLVKRFALKQSAYQGIKLAPVLDWQAPCLGMAVVDDRSNANRCAARLRR